MEHKNGQNLQSKQTPGQPGNVCKDDCKDDASKKPDKFGQSFAGKQTNPADKSKPDYNTARKHA